MNDIQYAPKRKSRVLKMVEQMDGECGSGFVGCFNPPQSSLQRANTETERQGRVPIHLIG